MADWEYCGGSLYASGASTRIWRSEDDVIGRITRWQRPRGAARTRYFVWSKLDSAGEYESEDEARQAAAETLAPRERE